MPTFLYIFGFESPRQFRDNAATGRDDEDSQGVLIDAGDETAALAWGQKIAERFIQLLFRDNAISWRECGYANSIEQPGASWPDQQLVTVGVFPDFGSWLLRYERQL
jgi:hypothetical protein